MKKQHPFNQESEGQGVFYAPWEKAFDNILTPFEEFIHRQTSSGLLLMAAVIIAMVLANSTLAEWYEHLLHTPIAVSVGSWILTKTLHHWVNDGLMVLFFFLVGLELKREILVGELAEPRQALLPIIAAIGGMAMPALIYFAINPSDSAANGWGIPMATDIAFAVGVLVLLANRVPKALITFLVALAIVDDLGAVVVIAIFYTDEIVIEALVVASVFLGLLFVLNFSGIRRSLPYVLVGAFLWLALLKSGVHATLAGVLTAFAIPARPKFDPTRFSAHVKDLIVRFDATHEPGKSIMTNAAMYGIVQTMENGVRQVETPLQRLEHGMHIPVAYVVIPLFALLNAGIPLSFASMSEALTHPVMLGITLGLVLGKFVGITAASWLALKLGVAQLPPQTNLRHIAGVSLLAGIGFTMSIFVAQLAFSEQDDLLLVAKTGILFASLLAGICGYLWLYWNSK